jgi:hypothetical protein
MYYVILANNNKYCPSSCGSNGISFSRATPSGTITKQQLNQELNIA